MIKLKKILNEIRLSGRTIQELLKEFQQFKDSDLIFFDVETMGFNPNAEYIQMTQLAVIVVDGATMKEKKSLNIKIELSDSTQRFRDPDSEERKDWAKWKETRADKTPDELLDMTGYFKDLPEKLATEKRALQIFINLIRNAKNPILVAHNASFDVEFVNVRGKRHGVQIPKTKVIDSQRLAKYYLIPVLEKLNKSEMLKKLRYFKEMKISDIKPDDPNAPKKSRSKDTEFERFTAEDGTEMLRITTGRPSVSLGRLTPALLGDIADWHDALADVKSTIGVFQKIIEILYANRNIDISDLQGKEMQRYKRMKKHT